MGYFIKRLDDNIINISLIQSVTIVDSTNILWTIKNGQTFLEEYSSVNTLTSSLESAQQSVDLINGEVI